MNHITYIEKDGAGQWSWTCDDAQCRAEATGFETADEVLAAAKAHGPLAANSMIPVDADEED